MLFLLLVCIWKNESCKNFLGHYVIRYVHVQLPFSFLSLSSMYHLVRFQDFVTFNFTPYIDFFFLEDHYLAIWSQIAALIENTFSYKISIL